MFIGGAGAPAEPRQVGKALDRDLVRHLEREQEVRRHLGDKLFEEAVVGELVVSRIHAHGLEHLRILPQAKPLEARLGESPVPDVAVIAVKLAPPAGILPGGRADEDALLPPGPPPLLSSCRGQMAHALPSVQVFGSGASAKFIHQSQDAFADFKQFLPRIRNHCLGQKPSSRRRLPTRPGTCANDPARASDRRP